MNLEFILSLAVYRLFTYNIYNVQGHLLLKHTVYISFRRIEIYTIMAIYNILY